MRRSCLYALVLLLSLYAAPALARTDAAARYQSAMRLYQGRHYAAAVLEFERALAAGGDRVILYDIAQAHRMAGHTEEALAYYRQFLRAAPMSPLRFSVKEQVARLHARMARQSRRVMATRGPTVAVQPALPPSNAPVAPAPIEPPPVVAAAPIAAPIVNEPPVAVPVEPLPIAAPPESVAMVAPSYVAPIAPTDHQEAAPRVLVPVEPARVPATDASRDQQANARTTRQLELGGAGLMIGGAALLGAGIGCFAGAAIRSHEVDEEVRFDPATEASGIHFQAAGAVLSMVGAAAMLVGGELFRRHAARTRRAVVAAPSGQLGLSF